MAERYPITDYATECERFGLARGERVPSERQDEILDLIAQDAADIFGSPEGAREALETLLIYGVPMRQVIATSGIARILSRLDELRFGWRG